MTKIKSQNNTDQASQSQSNQPDGPRRYALNPFELSTLSDHSLQQRNGRDLATMVNHRVSLANLISPDSFERRRSVYERSASVAVSTNQQFSTPPEYTAVSSPHLAQTVRYNNDEPALISNGDHESAANLSLDGILANLQMDAANGLQMIDSDGVGRKTSVLEAQATELLEFTQPLSENGLLRTVEVDEQINAINQIPIIEVTSLSEDKSSQKMIRSPTESSVCSLATTSHDKTPSLAGSGDLEQDQGRRKARDDKAKQHERNKGFEIAWLDFTYSVEPNMFEDPRWGKINSIFHKEKRMILKGLSGGVRSGQMVALMGPSGAGKTCLLESISGVRTTGIGGRMCLRGRKKAELVIVPQYDDFMPQFTVEETIIYGSRMKNGYRADHRKVTNKVIDQLGLQICRTNNIQRCSGGQRKRVAIAQELVSKPNILVLDEPTSGLDSSCCYHTVKVLRDVLDESVASDEPMAIVCTIHQPSAKVFKMFDLVYLLGKTGYMAYSGPPDDLVSTIRDVTGLECPKYSNPSDFMIELVAYDYGEEPVEKLIEFEKQKAIQYKRDFEKRAGLRPGSSSATGALAVSSTTRDTPPHSDSRSSSIVSLGSQGPRLVPSKSDTQLTTKNSGTNQIDLVKQRLKVSELVSSGGHVTYKNNVTVPLRKATSGEGRRFPFLWHLWVHLHRSYLQAIRDPILNNMRILIHLGFATLLVLLYGRKSGRAKGCPPVLGLPQEITDPDHESMIDLADNIGYLFMCMMMITYVSLMSTVLTFPIDIKTVGKEYKNGWYGTMTYFLGKTIADMPFIIMYPVVYCILTWFLTDQAQDDFWRYLNFTGLVILNAMNSQSFGLILGALFVNSVTAATFLGPVITIPWYLFTGFTKRIHRLAEPFKTGSKFLFTRYVFEGILDTVYGHERCDCEKFLKEYQQLRYDEANRLGQLISMEALSSLDYYDGIEQVADVVNETLFPAGNSNWLARTVDAASTVFADNDNLDMASLMNTNVKANSLFSFGLDFEPTCPKDYKSYIMQDFRISENNVEKAFGIVFGMLCAIRVVTFILVSWKIRTRQL